MSAIVLLCARVQKPFDVTGPWVARFAITGLSDRESNRYQSWALQLNQDGTFTGHLEMHIMVNIVEDDRGTYVLSGSALHLKGSSQGTLDDGYRKENNSGELDYKLTEANGRLTLVSGGFWARNQNSRTHIVFWRRGEVPVPPPPARNPIGVAILRKVESVYAGCKSYKDEGTFKTQGKEPDGWKVRFLTRFARSKALRFEATMRERGKVTEQDAVWSQGSKAWMSISLDGGSRHQVPLEQALKFAAHEVGIEALLIPHLLTPSEFTRSLDKAYPGIVLKGVEKVGGKACSVLNLSNPDEEMHLTIWVDNASHLILQASMFGNAMIVYKPIVNGPLTSKDLAGHQVPPGKARPHHLAPRGSEGDP